jgi:hypothetical protein
MQYRGQYPPDVLASLKKAKRSSVYYRLTTNKVNTMTARLMDLLFPARQKNWSLEPTPDPDLPRDILLQDMQEEITAKAQGILQGVIGQMQAEGIMPDEFTMQKMNAQAFEQAIAEADTSQNRVRIAEKRAAEMERTVDDQLKEASVSGQRRPSWQQNCRAVIKSACLYGMGVLKGPLVEKVSTKKFVPVQDEFGNTSWQEEVVGEKLRPYHEAISIWNVFPDPSAVTPEELRYVWQSHLKTDKDLLDLSVFPGFRQDIIRDYIRLFPEGDAQPTQWESQARQINGDNSGASLRLANRYRVYERWGYVSGKDLAEAGIEVEDEANVYPANMWMLGDKVIKAVINPLEGVDIPYFFYPFQPDETSFWPEGIASMLRAPQAGINASVRAMQDNAGASSGPVYGINVAALSPGEDVLEMLNNRLFLFERSGMTLDQAFRAVTVPSCIEHNLTLAKFWQEAGDEISTPRFNTGDGRVSGAGETASGLSMLMGAANILLKDHIKDFDDTIVTPFIRAMFRWNMQWNENEAIKGDYEIVSTGSQSLISKEVRAQQIPVVMNMLQSPLFASRIKADALVEVALEQTDLPADRLLRSEEEAKQYEAEQMQMQSASMAAAQVQELTAELEKRGATPDIIQQQLVDRLAQASTGQQVTQ